MTSLIEKVKKAIQDARDDPAQPDHWEAHDAIQVVLREMMEPSEETKQLENVHWGYSCHVCGGWKEAWQTLLKSYASEHNIDLTGPKP